MGQVSHLSLGLDGQTDRGTDGQTMSRAPCLASVFQLQPPSPGRVALSKTDFGDSVIVDCLKRRRVLNVKWCLKEILTAITGERRQTAL